MVPRGMNALALTFALAVPAVAGEAAAREAVIVKAVENMYSGPDEARDVVSQALLGQIVAVVEQKDGFLHVETPDRYRGWLPASAALAYAGGEARYASRGPVLEITSLMANVYREADVTTARPLAQAPLGTRLEVVEGPRAPRNEWVTVRLPSRETGYVQLGDGRLGDAATPRRRGGEADLVATARRFLGTPYLWGGMSTLGVDCSGLVSRVYSLNGLVIPRDADLQFDDPGAAPIGKKRLRPGDLVFFGKEKITHVGMYVGKGRFINATTHEVPVVQEDRLDDPHWAALYKGARRPGVNARR